MKQNQTSAKPPKEPRLSRTHAPSDLAPLEWQRALRRQFGREQAFGLENCGTEPFFSEFRVSNLESKSTYRVAIRGLRPGDNFCACPDYAMNELGTCKHIEFTLAKLAGKRGAKAAFAGGCQLGFGALPAQRRRTRDSFPCGVRRLPALTATAELGATEPCQCR